MIINNINLWHPDWPIGIKQNNMKAPANIQLTMNPEYRFTSGERCREAARIKLWLMHATPCLNGADSMLIEKIYLPVIRKLAGFHLN